ncbi:hypothetical protein CVT25_012359 [Psilocybe cyanescens]|uniref:DDE-1 domain-containing protein n=1 Tax=Psilocybe cyanescens TaxID=93625 RepID=A0A409W3P9_PSICY|nr:hypothetical protein CVT25_012359 [Psilocybe cyanescens]
MKQRNGWPVEFKPTIKNRNQQMEFKRLAYELQQNRQRITTKKCVHIDHNTLSRQVKGGRSLQDLAQEKAWSKLFEEIIISYTIKMAQCGWPLSHHHIYCFPKTGVSRRWTNCFTEHHFNRLKPYWSHALDKLHACAINPFTKEAYFKLFYETIKGGEDEEPILDENTYGVDKTGIHTHECVFGPARGSVQHQQHSGDRENITVIVIICADGTSLSPAVIFKGEGYQSNWRQDNPLNAS